LKQKIILINGRFMMQPITGVQRFAREVIGELAKREEDKFRFIIALPRRNVTSPIQGIETYQDNSHLPTFLWQQIRIPYLLKKLNADLLWSPCNIGPVFTRNHLVSIHDTAPFAGPEWFSRPFRTYYRFIFPLLGQRAIRVITPSTFSEKEIVRHGIAKKKDINVIQGGVSSTFTRKESSPYNHPYILTVGSINPRKNISKLIASWERIPIHIKEDRKLVITGGEESCYPAENFGDIPDDITFTGYIPDEDLPSLYSGADAFAFPSLYEGFGLPPLEAMACGCPVITSKLSSMPEVCGDAAYYIDPHSTESIKDGIIKVLTDRDLREGLIQKGLERAKLFTWQRSAEKHIKVFMEVLDR
jgi:glycosyltransferase involved in cell wall biosynthesis